MQIKKLRWEDHEEWLEVRSHYIGGSDAGSVIGTNPYRSAYALWAEKTGKVKGFEGNTTTKVGGYLEEFVAQMFEDETGKKVRRNNFTLVNEDYPFACANIDRDVVGENALLEIKTTNSFPIMKQLKGTEFPDAYYAQVVHYLAVTGYEKAYLAVLINCREFKIYELYRDQAEIDALMEAEKGFWALVESDTPPAIDGSDSTENTIKLMYPEANDLIDAIDVTAVDSDIAEYMRLSAHIKELETLKKQLGNVIKDFLKEASKGESERFKVSYPQISRSSFDDKRFQADHSSMDLSMYYKTSSYRNLKITEKKEN